MGCEGVRITDPAQLGAALKAALASNRPTVIDVLTSLEVSFDDLTSPLAGPMTIKR
jgi:thiamine pyrophosphate-dependent acetolactate synthase large subunit-like protein